MDMIGLKGRKLQTQDAPLGISVEGRSQRAKSFLACCVLWEVRWVGGEGDKNGDNCECGDNCEGGETGKIV